MGFSIDGGGLLTLAVGSGKQGKASSPAVICHGNPKHMGPELEEQKKSEGGRT